MAGRHWREVYEEAFASRQFAKALGVVEEAMKEEYKWQEDTCTSGLIEGEDFRADIAARNFMICRMKLDEVSRVLHEWGVVLRRVGQYRKAESRLSCAIKYLTQCGAYPDDGMFEGCPGHPLEVEKKLTQARIQLAQARMDQDDLRDARILLLRIVHKESARDHPEYHIALHALGRVYERIGERHPLADPIEVEAMLRHSLGFHQEALRMRRELHERAGRECADAEGQLQAARARGGARDAEKRLRQAVAAKRSARSEAAQRCCFSLINLGICTSRLAELAEKSACSCARAGEGRGADAIDEKYSDAEELFQRAIAGLISEQQESLDIALAHEKYGDALIRGGYYAAAERQFREALAMQRQFEGDGQRGRELQCKIREAAAFAEPAPQGGAPTDTVGTPPVVPGVPFVPVDQHPIELRIPSGAGTLLVRRAPKAIARGGFGTVYHGEMAHPSRGRMECAVKEVTWKQADLPPEAAILTRLEHRNIVECFGHGLDAVTGTFYLIMEYVPSTLYGCIYMSDAASKARQLPMPLLHKYALQILHALHHCHSQRPEPVLHRDLKPSNILIDEDQELVKVCDWGSSKFQEAGAAMGHTTAPETVHYVSPEAVTFDYCGMGENPRRAHAVDTYAFGVVMLEMYTARRPWMDQMEGALGNDRGEGAHPDQHAIRRLMYRGQGLKLPEGRTLPHASPKRMPRDLADLLTRSISWNVELKEECAQGRIVRRPTTHELLEMSFFAGGPPAEDEELPPPPAPGRSPKAVGRTGSGPGRSSTAGSGGQS
eukprot:TRINITY_DN12503_c0_g1_i1.p1 TRINITY_DN12503_c0_g1~~TRINITY_DN12503_c0_g1_i1.p1  ORF type:complete len:777 (+),score=205.73 TRINITY_DN12503_c0_g1_i1:98-2428(+)